MRRSVMILFLASFATLCEGCMFFDKDDDGDRYPWSHLEGVTDDGYRFAWIEKGTSTKPGPWEATRPELDALLSMAIRAGAKRLAATYQGPDEAQWIAIMEGHRWVGVDDVNFMAADGSGYAAGEHAIVKPMHWIRAAYYSRMPSAFGAVSWTPGEPTPWPEDTPPWLIKENPSAPGQWRWGELRTPYPAISNGHEAGHHVWGPRFEHGWTPPLRPGVSMKPRQLAKAVETCSRVGW